MNQPTVSLRALQTRYATFVLASVTAAILSAAVALTLLANFARRVPDPLTAPSYVSLKERLRAEPDAEPLKQQIRALDLELRQDYFRRRQVTYYGTWLLLAGVLGSIAAAKTAATVYRRLPRITAGKNGSDPELRLSRQAISSVAGLAVLLAATIIGLRIAHRSLLTRDLARLAVATSDMRNTPGKQLPASPRPQPAAATAQKLPAQQQPTQQPPAQQPPAAPQPVVVIEPKPPADPAQKPVKKQEPSPAPTAIAVAPAASLATLPAPQDFLSNWHRFRGPDGSGISPSPEMPMKWDGASGSGIVWKSPVPLSGNSSPIVWKDAVFLTGATDSSREVYCFDAASGTLRWKTPVPADEAPKEPPEVSEDTGFAASTPTTDGIRVFAIFATGDLIALDYQGKQAWLRRFGTPQNTYGHASSLVFADGLLLVQMDQGSKDDKLSKLMALNPVTGQTVWEAPRDVPSSWTTPIVIENGGQRIVVTCASPWVIAYTLKDGKELWRTKSLRQDVGPSPIAAGETVIAANEFPGVSAIRLGGQGDVTASHVVWSADAGAPDTCSPLLAGKLLLLQASFGTLTCYDAAQGGNPLWEEEFDENFRSSPGLAGQNVYLFAESGKSWIVRPTQEKCERVSESNLGEGCVTTPAFLNGRIYIRGKEHLFCLGKHQTQ